jgi:mRNA interferase HigB
MRVIALKMLREFWHKHASAEQSLRAWFKEVENADWEKPSDVKAVHPSASFLNNNRVVFNIKGNTYRLVTRINYPYRIVYTRFIGTHAEYDKINAEKI